MGSTEDDEADAPPGPDEEPLPKDGKREGIIDCGTA